MVPFLVMVPDEFFDYSAKWGFPKKDQPVQTPLADRAHEAFGIRV
jgi:hypothetical protein